MGVLRCMVLFAFTCVSTTHAETNARAGDVSPQGTEAFRWIVAETTQSTDAILLAATQSPQPAAPKGSSSTVPKPVTAPPAPAAPRSPGAFSLIAVQPYCDTQPPVAPAVGLRWSSSSGAQNYRVLRNGTQVGGLVPGSGTTFKNNLGVTAGQSYSYQVQAINQTGQTATGSVQVSIPSGICPTPPRTSTLSTNTAVTTPQTPKPAPKPALVTAPPAQTSKPASQPAPVTAPPAPVALPVPQIVNVTPSQITTSAQIQTITINGSGFDSGARVEWMYGIGTGAGQWRTPLHGFQVLNNSQIRVNVLSGSSPDQLRIRVTNSRGSSNQANVVIAKAATAPAVPAPTVPQSASVTPVQPSPPKPSPTPLLTATPPSSTAGTTPQTLKPVLPPAPVTAPPAQASKPGSQSKPVTVPAPVAPPVPQIANVTPSQLPTSTQIQTITIIGSGFDSGARVEWMYGVGAGAGQWRTPLKGYQVISSSQIRVNVLSGSDPDQLRIRVTNSRGYSNHASVVITRVAPAQVAQPSPPKPSPSPPLTSTLPGNMAGTTPQISKPAPQPAPVTALPAQASKPASQPKPVTAPAPVALLLPQIASVTPTQLPTSSQTQTITINGSGFDSGARVEWMYGVGTGAGQWRTPLKGFQVLSSSQIRVNVLSGSDPDQLRIRVTNSRGSSNQANVVIEKAAPAQVAQPSPPLNPSPTPPPTSTLPGNMAGTTPQTSTPAQLPHTVTYCGSKWYQRLGLQFAEALQATMGGYSFDVACQAHDACYGDCRTSKTVCDTKLRADAEGACASARNKPDCMADAWIFFQRVSDVGDIPFKQARAQCPASLLPSSTAVTTPPTLKPALLPTPVTTPPALPVPQIASVTPTQLPTSTQTQTITINGSGFDSGARVEWMYGVGTGAGQWRTPLQGFQILSTSRIRVNVLTGADPDQLRIRVTNSRGSSNQASVVIAKAPTAPVAAPVVPAPAVPQITSVTPAQPSPPKPIPAPPLTATPPSSTVGTTPQTSKPASQPASVTAPPALPVPQIANATPSQLTTSTQTQTITINGSGFDSGARVELMYGMGAGAGQWRTPLQGYQLLSSSQIRMSVLTGADPDQLRIRVTNSRGSSNETRVVIAKAATAPVATPAVLAPSVPPIASVTPAQPSPPKASPTPPLTAAPPTSTAVTTPQTSKPATQPAPVTATPAQTSKPALQPAPAAAPPAPVALPMPQIATVTPSKIKEKVEDLVPTLKRPPPPVVTRIEPSAGAPGIRVKVYGKNLNPQATLQSSLFFEAVGRAKASGDIVTRSEAVLEAIVPQGNGSVDVRVETVGGSSSKLKFNYLPPRITDIRPASGERGQQVQLIGENFGVRGSVDVGTFVKFGESLSQAMPWDDKRIIVTAPSDFGTGTDTKILLGSFGCIASFGVTEAAKIVLDFAIPGCQSLAENLWNRYQMKVDPGFITRDVRVSVKTSSGTSNERVYTYRAQAEIRNQSVSPTAKPIVPSAPQIASVTPAQPSPPKASPPQTSKPAAQPAPVTAPPAQTSKPASQLAPVAAPPAPVVPPVPQIANVTPSQLPTSSQAQTITINGSGFDSGARVEWMYGVGSGAGQWRTPLHGFQVLNRSQIRVSVLTGAVPDQLRIRVANSRGYSNEARVVIVKAAPAQITQPTPTPARVAAAGDVHPAVTIESSTVTVGEAVKVSGSGFTPQGPATIRLQHANGSRIPPIQVTADEQGKFAGQYPLPLVSPIGAYTLSATDNRSGIPCNNLSLNVQFPSFNQPGPASVQIDASGLGKRARQGEVLELSAPNGVPVSVTLSGERSVPPFGRRWLYQWMVDGAMIGDQSRTSYHFDKDGNHSVQLTVTEGSLTAMSTPILANATSLITDIKVHIRWNNQKCPGRVGKTCAPQGLIYTIATPLKKLQQGCDGQADRICITGYASVGAIKHDACCVKTSNNGFNCEGLFTGSRAAGCGPEWDQAELDWIRRNTWEDNWNYGLGDNDPPPSAKLKAPRGTLVAGPEDAKYCALPQKVRRLREIPEIPEIPTTLQGQVELNYVCE